MSRVTQQTRKPLMCKYCQKVEITFSKGRVSKAGKMIPLNAQTMGPHNCSENPYNQQQKTAEVKEASPERALEIQELNHKIDLIVKQLTALCQKYDVVMDSV